MSASSLMRQPNRAISPDMPARLWNLRRSRRGPVPARSDHSLVSTRKVTDADDERLNLEIGWRPPRAEDLQNSLLCIFVLDGRALLTFVPSDHVLHDFLPFSRVVKDPPVAYRDGLPTCHREAWGKRYSGRLRLKQPKTSASPAMACRSAEGVFPRSLRRSIGHHSRHNFSVHVCSTLAAMNCCKDGHA
jgi:hypothetical protein